MQDVIAVSVDLDLVSGGLSAVEAVLTAGLLDVPSSSHCVSLSFLTAVYQKTAKPQEKR